MGESETAAVGGNATTRHLEAEVLDRYARGAERVEPALCCPIEGYDPAALALLPREIIEKDYGCGDPSRWAREGETVLDLGSGGGKVCYILSLKVGPSGRVIGVDFNDAMLALARKYQGEMALRLGHDNVRFVKGRIQDLALDLDALDRYLAAHPVRSASDMLRLENESERLRRERPLIGSDSIDLVVSNCVLNLVKTEQKRRLFDEIFRVLRRGGRAVISDIVCDEPPTDRIMNDPELWSGCIAGVFVEHEFLEMFERAGFHGVEILARSPEPWRVIDGVEFRAMTVRAYKGKQGPCMDHGQAVVYRGPWKYVTDDDGHTYFRGRRMAVCEKTFHLLTDAAGPYGPTMIGLQPRVPIDAANARPFDCRDNAVRDPRTMKGATYHETRRADGDNCCTPGGEGPCC